RAVLEAVPMGLRVPLVYNTGGYETVETLKLLEGIIDIYLPDIRYADNEIARKYSHVKGYVEANRAAIEEMYRQVGNLKLDNDGVAKKGLIMRHLILPEGLAGSEASLAWLAEEISPEAHLSIMAQYYPAHRAPRYPALTRRINIDEYNRVMGLLERLGMENGWFQELDAPDSYQPDFTREGNPFTRENLKPP
ncbi:MAG: radical SAM protein, partial [Dehalococcoidia bacterium]|nr:radical SAM protein [Dehalococcoidia bacterium]